MAEYTAARPMVARVISRRDDGTGGVIEIPILPTAEFVDFSRTEGGGPSSGSISIEMLQELQDNFTRYPGPVGIGLGEHVSDRSGPQMGFIEQLDIRGGALIARIDLGPIAFEQVVAQRAWRAFSIEARRNVSKPTADLVGWTLVGGVFTNNPALDTHFRIAATDGAALVDSALIWVALTTEEDMSEPAKKEAPPNEAVELSQLKAANATLRTQHEALGASLQEAKDKSRTLEVALAEATQAKERAEHEAVAAVSDSKRHKDRVDDLEKILTEKESTLAEIRRQKHELEQEQLSTQVTRTINGAIKRGVAPAVFGDWKKDPSAWLKDNFVSLEALDRMIANLPADGRISASATSSGKPSQSVDDDESTLTATEKAELRRHGLDPAFADVTNSAQLDDLRAERKTR